MPKHGLDYFRIMPIHNDINLNSRFPRQPSMISANSSLYLNRYLFMGVIGKLILWKEQETVINVTVLTKELPRRNLKTTLPEYPGKPDFFGSGMPLSFENSRKVE